MSGDSGARYRRAGVLQGEHGGGGAEPTREGGASGGRHGGIWGRYEERPESKGESPELETLVGCWTLSVS